MRIKAARFVFSAIAIVSCCFGSQLANVSVRSGAGTGADTLIVGFSVGGTGSKSVLIRGIGPSLGLFGVPNVVTNPQLALYSGGTAIDSNDDWGGSADLSATFKSVGAFDLPPASKDAVLLKPMSAGSYSAQLVASSGEGIALVECYDTSPQINTTRLINISARSRSGSGANVLTVGFAIEGNEPETVLIRGIGPTLRLFGVTDPLQSTRVQLFNSNSIQIGDSAGWQSQVTPQSVFDSVGAFGLPVGSQDAVLFFALPPGTYTAQLSGVYQTDGIGLIEVYEVANSPVSYVTMQPTSVTGMNPPSDPFAGTASSGPDALPSVISQSAPIYPYDLRLASVTGEAMVDFFVRADGSVANAVAIWSTDYRLAAASVSAVNTWTFNPGRKNGKLVTTHMQVPIIYNLK